MHGDYFIFLNFNSRFWFLDEKHSCVFYPSSYKICNLIVNCNVKTRINFFIADYDRGYNVTNLYNM